MEEVWLKMEEDSPGKYPRDRTASLFKTQASVPEPLLLLKNQVEGYSSGPSTLMFTGR